MKKNVLLFSMLLALFVLTGNAVMAQTTPAATTTATDPASTTTQIMTLINSKVKLSAQQQTDVQKVVSELATKYQGANKKASSSSGLESKVGKDEQNALNNKAATDIPNLLNDTQKTQYAGIQSKVTSLFSQIK